ncbi:MAB_1171c family putative transporter [Rhodococcus sp. NPDC003318]|uniref:MAB_1171c family putative transporter n=1 Tax=Rhodococcus sp. NPDC003318 TaxID=3364503 RepID=UPI0036B2F6A1
MLELEATSSLPPWASDPMLAILAVVIVGRLVFVRERQLDQQITWLLFWWLGAAVLREPWMQGLLMDATPLTLSDLRLLTHAAAMCGAGAIFLIVRAFSNVRRVRRRAFVLVYSIIAVEVALLAWISAPARSAGIAIEELHDWRTAAYMLIYSSQMPLALAAVAAACIRVFRHGDEARSTRIWAVLILLVGAVSAFDHLTRIVNGIMLALNQHNAFTVWRSESNDVLFLPAATALAIVVSWPIFTAIRTRRANDPSSAAVVALTPMWKDLSTAMPAISLQATTSTLPSSVEREHRMRIECEDALYELLPYMSADDRAEDVDPASRCAAITDALERRRSDRQPSSPVSAPRWLADEDELLRIADAWSTRPATAGLV